MRPSTGPSCSSRNIFPYKRNQVRITKKVASDTPQEKRECRTANVSPCEVVEANSTITFCFSGGPRQITLVTFQLFR
ncbi:hypothetical protein Fmac_001529 [Flemingia macrophylla]|uniref:Uncharacterized protein n=1 Tax=Flemingia macrophylla TaxID=520843 RepID=A0ABD1NHC6_9FABA